MSRSPDSGPVLPPPVIPESMQPLSEPEPLPEMDTKRGNISSVLDRFNVSRADDTQQRAFFFGL